MDSGASMTEPSYGEVFSLHAADSHSSVDLHDCPSDVTVLSQSMDAVQLMNASSNYPNHMNCPLIYANDNFGSRGYAFVTSNKHLQVYSVTTSGTPAIALESDTTFDTTDTPDLYFGVKKENDSLYYIFYASVDITTNHRCRFRRVSVVPGTGYTDTLLEEIALPATPTKYSISAVWKRDDAIVINRTGYLGLIKHWGVTSPTYKDFSVDLYVYSIDMETSTVSEHTVWEQPAPTGLDYNDNIEWFSFFNTNGSFVWTTAYVGRVVISGHTWAYGHVIIDGEDTELFSNHADTNHWVVTSGRDQYNKNTWVCYYKFDYAADTSLSCLSTIHTGMLTTVTTTDPIPTLAPGPLFPMAYNLPLRFKGYSSLGGVTQDPSNSYVTQRVDPTTAIVIDELTITGVDTIYNIFPTADHQTGWVYLSVKMNDDSIKLIGISWTGGGITTTLDVELYTAQPTAGYNHGNFLFLMRGYQLATYAYYLINLPEVVVSDEQIFEQN